MRCKPFDARREKLSAWSMDTLRPIAVLRRVCGLRHPDTPPRSQIRQGWVQPEEPPAGVAN
jgi:hypothetical protein